MKYFKESCNSYQVQSINLISIMKCYNCWWHFQIIFFIRLINRNPLPSGVSDIFRLSNCCLASSLHSYKRNFLTEYVDHSHTWCFSSWRVGLGSLVLTWAAMLLKVGQDLSLHLAFLFHVYMLTCNMKVRFD